jgi:hypothetical protein
VTAWVLDWVRAFALTLLIEELVALPLLGRFDRSPRPAGRYARLARHAAAIALVNLATHPLVWFLFPGLSAGYGFRVAASEAWALAAEGAAYLTIWPDLGPGRAFLVALLANAASFCIGLALR